MRRGVLIAAAALVTAAAILGLLAFFASRDDSTIGEEASAPGLAAPDAAADELERGNVVVRYAEPRDAAALRELAREFGPESLAAQGQAVIVRRDAEAAGILAEAYKRRIRASAPEDPKLREFVQYWLGRGAMP